jgi:hypothetical protein
VRRFARLGILGVVVTALVALGFGSPAQAATNPYTPQEACNHQFGGTWSVVTDGHRVALTDVNVKWGDVYLLYNSATGYNCVATIKTEFVGLATLTVADLLVQGSSWGADAKWYSYYAAVETKASDKCVQYMGQVYNTAADRYAQGQRLTWGNCG